MDLVLKKKQILKNMRGFVKKWIFEQKLVKQ